MVNEDKNTLKYLGFVLSAVSCVFNLYDFVKDNSGPFEDIIDFVEGIVEPIVGPAYDKFQDVLIEVLKFVDLKIDEYALKLHDKIPHGATQAFTAVSEAKRVGAVAAAAVILTSVSDKYSAKAEQIAVKALAELNRLPLVSQAAQLLLPTVGYCLEKYNDAVSSAAEKGYKVSGYLPLVPTEKIAKVVGAEGAVRVWRSFFRSPGLRFSVFMI